jgi:hypothetical protein
LDVWRRSPYTGSSIYKSYVIPTSDNKKDSCVEQ